MMTTSSFDYCDDVIIVQEANPADFTNETDEGAPQSISLLLTYDLENWTPGGWAHYLEGTKLCYGLFVLSRSLSQT